MMKLKHLDPEWKVKRPVRAAVICFSVLAALFAIFSAFAEVPVSRMSFFLCGLGYSAVLAFLSIGLSVLPFPWRRRVFIGMMMIPIFGVLVGLSIMATAYFGYPLAILGVVLPPLMWFLGFVIVGIVVLASFGWYWRISDTSQATT